MHVIVCASVCDFRGRNSCKREGAGVKNAKPEKNSIVLKNGKMVTCHYSTSGKSGKFLDLEI